MQITERQMAVFQARAEESLVGRVVTYLRINRASAVGELTGDDLNDRVRAAITRGRSHGFTWESSLIGYVILTFDVGPRFDEHPAFQAALRITSGDERARILRIYDSVTDDEWREVQHDHGY